MLLDENKPESSEMLLNKPIGNLRRFIHKWIDDDIHQDVLYLIINNVSFASLLPGPGETNVQTKIDEVQSLIRKQKPANTEDVQQSELYAIEEEIREFRKIKRGLTKEEHKKKESLEEEEIKLGMEIKGINDGQKKYYLIHGDPKEIKEEYTEKIKELKDKLDDLRENNDGKKDRAIERKEKRLKKLETDMKKELDAVLKELPEKFSEVILQKKKIELQQVQLRIKKLDIEKPYESVGSINWEKSPWVNFAHRRPLMTNLNLSSLEALGNYIRGKLRNARKHDEDRRRECDEHYLEAKTVVAKLIRQIWFFHKHALSGSNNELIQKMKTSKALYQPKESKATGRNGGQSTNSLVYLSTQQQQQ